MSWRPGKGWLFVERIETEESFAGSSIIIPTQARERTALWQYTVLAQGPLDTPDEDEEPFTPSILQPGDWVMARQRAAVQVFEENLILLAEQDCVAVIR